MPSAETELLAYLYTAVKTAATGGSPSVVGLDPSTGNPRSVGVFNQVSQDAPVPYIRITLTDTNPIDDEPFGYSYVPTAKRIMFMLDVWSDYEPEVFQVASQLVSLLQHQEVTTAHFHGSTWFKSSIYFVETLTNPDRVLRRASIRIQANLDLVS